MENSNNSLLTRIRSYIGGRPFFFKIMFILIAVVFTLILAFYIFAQRRNTTILLDQYYSAQEYTLNSTVKNVNSSMSALKILARTTLFNSNVMHSIISPDPLIYTDKLAVVRVLSDTAEQNQLVDYISLYVKRTDSVYDSNESIHTLEDCALKDVWTYYFSAPVQEMLADSYESAIISYKGNIYLAQGYSRYLHFSNAVLLLRISDSIFAENIVNDRITVYDANNVLLYGPGNYDKFIRTGSYDGDTIYRLDTIHHSGVGLYYTDMSNGWQYLFEIDEPGSSLMPRDAFRLLILALIILGVGIAACILISINLYRPINQLIQTTRDLNIADSQDHTKLDEFAYLKAAYSDLLQNKSALENLFPFLYTMAAEKYFEALLFEAEAPSDDLVARLDAIAGSLGFFDHFLAVIVSAESRDGNVPEELNALLSASMPDALSDHVRRLCMIGRPNLGMIVVLAFSGRSEGESIDSCYHSWRDSIAEHAAMPVAFYRGQIYSHIQETRKSFEEACANALFGRYSASEKLPALHLTDAQEQLIYRIWNYCETLETSEEDTCAVQCAALCDEISSACPDRAAAAVIYAFFIYVLTEKSVRLELIPKDSDQVRYAVLAGYRDMAKLRDSAGDIIRQKSTAIFRYYHAANYGYVKSAIDYIETHFTDTSLSLNEVSQAININASYLSHLFTSTVGQSFVYYVNSYRVNQARNLLSNSEFPIQDIGMMVGFNNMTTFYRVFKKYTGMTPKAYRDTNL